MIPTTQATQAPHAALVVGGAHVLHAIAGAPSLPQLGNWQLVHLAGEGAMAHVYQARPAHQCGGPACYAVKVLKRQWEESPAAVELVRSEAVAGHQFAHPHLVSVLDWQIAAPPYYVVMPYLAGATLDRILAAGQVPALPVAVWIARQAAQGLAALHAAGWMHGDVTPGNLLVGHDGHVTLLDLGYARPGGQACAAADRPLLGTLGYMAPEMFTSAHGGDVRSDLYSLGGVLHYLLTGQAPFAGCNPAEISRLQRETVPERIRTLAPHVPSQLADLVRRMLSKQPLRRPQTPDEVVQRLVEMEIQMLPERLGA